MDNENMRSWLSSAFHALHGQDVDPFPWQEEAFRRLTAGEPLGPVDVPTGLGKTAIITVWLLALAWHRLGRGAAVPTRLFYVVNRRAVVDQSSEEAERLRERLNDTTDPVIRDLRAALDLSDGEELLVSTLRGQRAENRDWMTDPARPAIVVGTVDMVGSRLLFSAYRAKPWLRALYAGLIGQDALIVHDEAHLEPAFDALIRSVAAMQGETGGEAGGAPVAKPLRVLSLSATLRRDAAESPSLFDTDAHLKDDEAQRRLEAKRALDLQEVKPADLAGAMAERALLLGDVPDVRGVIVFANRPDTAMAVAAKLRKSVGDTRVAVLTGRMRGHERDQLVGTPAFAAFLPNQAGPEHPLDGAAFLVATSAGEVGIDLDATHLVSELATLDAMAQRFGRANRRGAGAASLSVLWTSAHTDPRETLGEQRARTLALLETLGGDASPLAMAGCLKSAEARLAMAPAPDILPLEPSLVENWAQTSIPDRDFSARPDVERWLHGLEKIEPEVTLVWRAEVAVLADPAFRVSDRLLERAVEAMRPAPRERLRLPLSAARDALARLGRRLKDDAVASRILLSVPGHAPEVRAVALGAPDLQQDVKPGTTLFLPVEAGGLGPDGHLDPAAGPRDRAELDVADPDEKGCRDLDGLKELRLVLDGTDKIMDVLSPQSAEATSPLIGKPLKKLSLGLRELLRVPLKPRGEEGEDGSDESTPQALVYLVRTREAVQDSSSLATGPVHLGPHNKAVGAKARMFATRLGLPAALCEALGMAGERHDLGKARPVWQRAIGNTGFGPASPPDTALAKSGTGERAEALGGFRHELASLLDAADDPEVTSHPERDLILHLIATHHGRGRPGFTFDAFDKGGDRSLSDHENALDEQELRFHRLQRRFGPWGLAWLEAVLRAADWAVSRDQKGEGAP
ncbi:type I-G CRISPR-associated helicase/endonuclease Cas3g [Azospirillum sp. sgz302134]